MFAVLACIGFGTVLYGAYRICARLYQINKGCDNDTARKKIKGRIIDIAMGTPQYSLYQDVDFNFAVKSDIQNILNEEDFRRWSNLFNTKIVMEYEYYNSGLPFYAIQLIIKDEDTRHAYEATLCSRAKDALIMHNCYADVLFDWRATNGIGSKMEWLEIRYARTHEEIEILKQTMQTDAEKKINETGSTKIVDEDLEKEIHNSEHRH